MQACRAAGQQAEQLQAELLWAAAALHDDQVAAISAAGVSGYGRLVRHVVHEPRLSKASAAAVWWVALLPWPCSTVRPADVLMTVRM